MRSFHAPLFLAALALFGCDDKIDDSGPSGGDTAAGGDADGDGFAEPEDCDDSDSSVHPDAEEVCDGADNNCDGQTDEGVTQVMYTDADADGYGTDDSAQEACPDGADLVSEGGDCDDADPEINPAAAESCDGVDNDCDGEIDDDVQYTTWYVDGDGDGYGDLDLPLEDCVQPKGYVDNDLDCDDTDATINPDGIEVCDGADNDCDGTVDEADAADAPTWYQDADGDGYGDPKTGVVSCSDPGAHTQDNTDCDDSDAGINPGATEICDDADADEDCNGLADDADGGTDSSSMESWYPDSDADGYGDEDYRATLACEQPSGQVADNSDCDDGDASSNPGASEVCDDADNDCDGSTDEGPPSDASTWYRDSDGDLFGDPDFSVVACDQPTSFVGNDDDCDDSNPLVTHTCGDTGDTGSGGYRDGTYEGTVEIDVSLAAMGVTDVCAGDITIEVVEADSPQITGSGTCEFSGFFSHYFSAQTGSFEGDISTDPDCDGTITVGTLISDDWEGTFPDDITIEGEFDGSLTYSGLTVDYVGTFEAER